MAEKKSVLAPLMKLTAGFGKPADVEAPAWIKYVAMLTGVLAAVAGFLAVRSTNLTNDAIYQSNQAVLSQTQASDAWAEYQADSIKARIIETQLVPSSPLGPEDRAALGKTDKEIRTRQPVSRQTAAAKTRERDQHLALALKHLEEKDVLGYASLAIQLGIALASVAALVRMRLAFAAGVLAGLAGIALTAYAFTGHVLAP